MTTAASVRVIVASVGYRNLRDHSLGVAVTDRLERETWPEGVVVEDLSYNPIAVVQRLEDEPPDQRFQRAVVVAAVERNGRAPGTIAAYRWDGVLPDEVIVVEVEPAVHEFGDSFSDVVARRFETVCDLVRAYATSSETVERLPRAPLGGSVLTAGTSI